jgi:type IV pilus assembly protein PilO
MKLFLEIIKGRKKTFIFLIALLAANVGIYMYVAIFQEPRLELLRKGWVEMKRQTESGINWDPSAVFSQGTADLASFQTRMPSKKEYARLVGELFEMAADNGLQVKGISYKPAPLKEEQLLVYTITLGVAGKYAAVKSFIADMEQLHDLITIDHISLDGDALAEESVKMQLQLTAYLRLEGQ